MTTAAPPKTMTVATDAAGVDTHLDVTSLMCQARAVVRERGREDIPLTCDLWRPTVPGPVRTHLAHKTGVSLWAGALAAAGTSAAFAQGPMTLGAVATGGALALAGGVGVGTLVIAVRGMVKSRAQFTVCASDEVYAWTVTAEAQRVADAQASSSSLAASLRSTLAASVEAVRRLVWDLDRARSVAAALEVRAGSQNLTGGTSQLRQRLVTARARVRALRLRMLALAAAALMAGWAMKGAGSGDAAFGAQVRKELLAAM